MYGADRKGKSQARRTKYALDLIDERIASTPSNQNRLTCVEKVLERGCGPLQLPKQSPVIKHRGFRFWAAEGIAGGGEGMPTASARLAPTSRKVKRRSSSRPSPNAKKQSRRPDEPEMATEKYGSVSPKSMRNAFPGVARPADA